VTEYCSIKASAMNCRLTCSNSTSDCKNDIRTVTANSTFIHWFLPMERDEKLGIEAATIAGYNISLPFSYVEIPAQSRSWYFIQY